MSPICRPFQCGGFFGLLVEGYLTMAECYAAGTPYMSWRMVLIGDPLYRPFINAGRKAN